MMVMMGFLLQWPLHPALLLRQIILAEGTRDIGWKVKWTGALSLGD